MATNNQASSNLPICLWDRRQTLPIDPGNQPFPFCLRQLKTAPAQLRPDKPPFVQSALAQPNASAVPHQYLDAVVRPVVEHEGRSCTGRMPQLLLHNHRQAIHSAAHVHQVNGQPYRPRVRDQPRHCNNSPSQRGETVAGNSKVWPWGNRNRNTPAEISVGLISIGINRGAALFRR